MKKISVVILIVCSILVFSPLALGDSRAEGSEVSEVEVDAVGNENETNSEETEDSDKDSPDVEDPASSLGLEPDALVSDQEVFATLLADPREPQFAIRLANYHMDQRNFDAAAVSFGDYLPLYNFIWEEQSKLQFGIDGGVFSLFDLDTESNDLRNSDFILGLSLTYRQDAFSSRFRLSHISSHYGDEYVLNNPREREGRDNPSYETAEITLSYDWKGFRPYAEMGGIFRTTDPIKRLSFQGGLEYQQLLIGPYLGFVAAANLSTFQEQKWSLNQNYFAGIGLYGKRSRHVRIGAEFYHGLSPEGQFTDQKLYYWGFAFYFSP